MAEPDFTIDDYTRLKKAIALGAIKVKYADKEVTYESIEAMRNLLDVMKGQLGMIKPSGNWSLGEFSKGLNRNECDR